MNIWLIGRAIRRSFEFHIRRGHEKQDAANLKKWYEWFDKNGYKTSIKDNPTPLPQVLFKRNILVNASKEKCSGWLSKATDVKSG